MGTLTSTETDRLAAYTVGATASTGPFPITFPFADNDDIAVYVNGTKISTYGVTQGSAYGTSGNFITLQTGVTNSTVTVVSEASAKRSTTDSLTLTALNAEIDNIYANLQENQFDKTRSLNAPLTDATTVDMTLPSSTARAGRLLGFNSTTGNPEAGPDIASVSTVTQISADIGTVAGISSDVTSVAALSGSLSEISVLGTSANITNMATLGASGVVSNIATVAGVSSELAAAGTNATNAAASASAAANSAAAAAASFDTFDDRYLGSKSSEPSVDNDGNALVSGALYFNSTSNGMKVYDGGSWINASSAGAVSLLDYEYTATAGQTTFSGADNNSATLSYSAGNLIVTLNGIVLDNGSDYTATSGTSIVLASGAALNDHLAVVAFKSFTVADTVPASTGGTFAGNVAVTGNISVTGTVDGRDVAQAIPATLGSAGQVLTVNGGASAAAWASPAVGFAHTLNSGNPATTTNPSAVGHMWINTTSGEAFICFDATTNANRWVSLGVGATANIELFNATGGVKTTYGIYTVHTFLSSGNFVVSTATTKTYDYLIVAGGGGGGVANGGGGGGGAGGLLTGQVSKSGGTTYSVVVGAGGAGGTTPNYGTKGVAGGNSSVFSLTAIGGGYGGGEDTRGLGHGGSGGGASRATSTTAGNGTSGQGNNGGSVGVSNTGGGGGGAGAVGGNSSTGNGGNGGVGLSNSLRTGSGVFYAGGGGGGIEATNQHGIGGNGGGGDGGDYDEAPVAGTANTGGGGGGSGDFDNPNPAYAGANGGSGIVVIRYET